MNLFCSVCAVALAINMATAVYNLLMVQCKKLRPDVFIEIYTLSKPPAWSEMAKFMVCNEGTFRFTSTSLALEQSSQFYRKSTADALLQSLTSMAICPMVCQGVMSEFQDSKASIKVVTNYFDLSKVWWHTQYGVHKSALNMVLASPIKKLALGVIFFVVLGVGL